MITEFSFGKIVVNGKIYSSDIKIIDGRVIPDWWRDKGHRVDIDDISDILATKPEILVIGKGTPGFLKSTASLREYLATGNVELIEKKTPRAITDFNRLFQQGRKVAAGFHISC